MHTGIRAREGIVGRQHSLQVAAGEMDRTGVAGGGGAVGVLGRDTEGLGNARGGGGREAVDQEAGRLDDDAGLRSGDARGRGIGGRQRPGAGGFQGGAEVMLPGVGCRKRIVGRQHRLRIAAGEVDHAGVAGGDGAVGVLGRDAESLGNA